MKHFLSRRSSRLRAGHLTDITLIYQHIHDYELCLVNAFRDSVAVP